MEPLARKRQAACRGCMLDGLVAYLDVRQARRLQRSEQGAVEFRMAFGWAAAVAGVIFAFVAYLLVLFVLLALFVLSGAPATS